MAETMLNGVFDSLREMTGSVPVFLSPTIITFPADNKMLCECKLTIYNPYDFPIKFAVNSNNSSEYKIEDNFKVLLPRSVVQLGVGRRPGAPIEPGEKLQVQLYDCRNQQLIGRRYILVALMTKSEEDEYKYKQKEKLKSISMVDGTVNVHRTSSSQDIGALVLIILSFLLGDLIGYICFKFFH